ncbi:MAG: site-2 protease family protein [Rhodothermales bacterium]
MKNALKVGSAAGIGIFLHWTFGLLLVGILAFYLIQGESLAVALAGLGLVLALFACVVLHELGHALAARRFDVPTRDITLYPIGGVARLQRIPEEPMKEFWIALAGPAVNVVLAAILAAVLAATGGDFAFAIALSPGASFLTTLMWANVILFAFNLLPAFPMDGGRVLRALLALRMDYARATQIAASVGQGMAIFFGFVGLISFNPILLFIALFVYIGAQQEAQQAQMRAVTEGISVRQAMMTRFRTLTPEEPLAVAIDELIAGAEQDFPVLRDGEVVGVLTRKEIMKTLAEHGREATVGEALTQDCFAIEDSAMLDEAFRRMREARCSTIPVVRRGQLVGVLTLENVGELMMIASALRKAGSRSDLDSVLSS